MTTIKHIDDVLPHLVDGFVVMDKGDYKVIDYVHIGSGFDEHPVLSECRGLIFDKDGWLIRRPLHKFFNLGEKGVTVDSIDWSRPHVIMDKLDGSMIAPFMLNGEVRFGTRAGITEHSLRCEERHLSENKKLYRALWELSSGNRHTAIFEWTSPENQIVLQYPDDKLTLLAIRNNETGQYYPRKVLVEWADEFGVPLVEEVSFDHIEAVYQAEGIEGVVVWFPATSVEYGDGQEDDYFVKIKSEEYVRAHRAVSYFEREDMVLELVLNHQIDDIIPLVDDKKKQKLLDYDAGVWEEVSKLAYRLGVIVGECKSLVTSGEMSRKTFALEIAGQADERIRSCYFSILDGKEPLTVVKEKVMKYPEILNTRWMK